MNAVTTDALKVPGATLYYERRGAGPVLLMIPGGNGDAGPFERVADELASRYTVVTYDRRGFSRSSLDGPGENRKLLETDREDALRLLERLGDDPAYVFGSSSGAIVALDLLVRHPERMRAVVAHEPPLVALLPDAAQHLKFAQDVYETYRRSGAVPAMQQFNAGVGMESLPQPPRGVPLPPHVSEMLSRMHRNFELWLEHELRQYIRVVPDIAALGAVSNRLVLAGGQESKEHLPYRPNLVLAARLGLEVVDFPGNHIGYVTRPVDFAARLAGVLAEMVPGEHRAPRPIR